MLYTLLCLDSNLVGISFRDFKTNFIIKTFLYYTSYVLCIHLVRNGQRSRKSTDYIMKDECQVFHLLL